MSTLNKLSTYVSNTGRIERACVEDNVRHIIDAILSHDVRHDSWYIGRSYVPFIKVLIDNFTVRVFFQIKKRHITLVIDECVVIALYDFNGLYFKVLIHDLFCFSNKIAYNETANMFPEMYTFQENAFGILENKDITSFLI